MARSPYPEELYPESPKELWHGTVHGYTTRKCRGRKCKAAWSACQRAMKKRRVAETPWEAIPHGTVNGYNNYDCRCVPCTGANRAAVARYRAARRAREKRED